MTSYEAKIYCKRAKAKGRRNRMIARKVKIYSIMTLQIACVIGVTYMFILISSLIN
jgi:hypothetical protein